MKRIIAIIKPNMLDDVIFALHKIEDFPGATMTEVQGMGRSFHKHVEKRQNSGSVGYPTRIRIEIVCSDDRLADIISIIEENARTGKSGDGKIFISDISEAIRIRTGQRGEDAI